MELTRTVTRLLLPACHLSASLLPCLLGITTGSTPLRSAPSTPLDSARHTRAGCPARLPSRVVRHRSVAAEERRARLADGRCKPSSRHTWPIQRPPLALFAAALLGRPSSVSVYLPPHSSHRLQLALSATPAALHIARHPLLVLPPLPRLTTAPSTLPVPPPSCPSLLRRTWWTTSAAR